jgi:zinc protease
MTTRTPALLVLSAALIISGTVVFALPQQAAIVLTDSIPVDPAITIGQLPNGLKYYVRQNKKPEKRAELRLVVKAGSILEEEDQQGLAHFVEHMAFNGTEHFPKSEIISFIESLGMRFGADLNAYTSFDETVYMLTVPSDNPAVLDKALLVLEDWAHKVSFDTAEIDKERGVVLEEWRLRRGAGMRTLDKLFPILLNGSRYAERIPIGKPEILQSFKPERLKKFYTDWYRPDLMAVVVVGDFEKGTVENLVKSHFGSIPRPVSPRPRATYDVPDRPGTVFATVTDKETTSTSIQVENILPARPEGSYGYYREQIVDGLFSGMLNVRFSEMARQADAPFLGASAGRGPFISSTKEEAVVSARVKDDGVERGLEAILSEVERVARFGFTATELDRQKQNIQRGLERMLAEKDNRESGSRADEYIRNFLQQESLPGEAVEYELNQRFLPQVALDEINRRAREWFTDHNRVVTVTAPDGPGVSLPDEARLAAVIKAVPSKELKAYVDTVAGSVLLEDKPQAGRVVKTNVRDAIGVTEWELSNGVKVVLKPTTFKEDEIVFRATSPGGTSLASDKDYIPASTAAQVISAGGLGKFNATDLRKVLTGKIASAGVFIGELEEGLSGNASKKDLETMFQLIYMRFTAPRVDETIFGLQADQTRRRLANQRSTPEFAFSEALNSALGQNHPRRRVPSPETVDEWNLDKSLAFYKDRFADAGDFTFVFVGNFDIAAMKSLVERYLGGLPATHRAETWKDVGARLPTGVIEKKVEKGIEPKSQAAMVFSGPFEYDQTHRVTIRAMGQILQMRLLETLREELGGTYSVSVNQSYQKIPTSDYTVAIQFGCDPERTETLIKRVFEEIEKFKTDGPTDRQLSDEKEALLREFETSIKQNGYILNQMAFKYQLGEDVAGVWDVPAYFNKLNAAAIQEAAKKYLNTNNFVKVMLFPEKK